MTRELTFTVPGPPRGKERPRLGKHGNTYTPDRTRSYEGAVRVHALAAAMRASWRLNGDARYSLTVFAYLPNRRRVDLDNIGKAIADSMNALIYRDDSQIDEWHLFKAVDPSQPRVFVTVREITPAEGGAA
jgi:crossover junction endodeoxyribonuclease RusA